MGLAAICALLALAPAELELPAVFGDGMVLQREAPIAVWGRARPGEAVVVTLAERRAETAADADGAWRVELAPLPAGGPHRLRVEASTRIELEDVLVGEVWLAAGQSNLAMTIAQCGEAAALAVEADRPQLRFFREESARPATEPTWRGAGRWRACDAETVGELSALLYHFARALEDELDVPIGCVEVSAGGAPIESFLRREAQLASAPLREHTLALVAEHEAFDVDGYLETYRARRRAWKAAAARATAEGRAPPPEPVNAAEMRLRLGGVGELFNAKVAPLVPFTVRGLLWYQGEANHRRPEHYQAQLELLVRDWRALWGRGELPCAWVQLPDLAAGGGWPALREAMRRALALPATGMAVTIDTDEPRAVHPRGKRRVGERLARWALGEVYRRERASSGPLYESHEREGRALVLCFAHVDGGLVARGGALEGFELAGADGRWRPARAHIEGARVVVEAEGVAEPREVRYAFAPDPRGNLWNGAELPASPFTSVREFWR